MKKIELLLIFIFCLIFLSQGANWGLPNKDRAKVLFDNENEYLSSLPSLIQTYKDEKEKTNNKIYIDNYSEYKKNLDYKTAINLGLARYLIVPYAGDDAFTLKALKNLDPINFDIDPNYYFYGGGFIFSSAGALFIADKLNVIKLVNDISYYLKNPEEIGKIYLILRYIVILFASFGIVILFIISQKFGGKQVAYLASLFLLTNPETIASTHSVEPHAFVLPFFLLAILFSFKSLENNNNKNIIFFGLFSGISIGTQVTSLFLVLIYFYLLFEDIRNKINYKIIFNKLTKYFVSLLIAFVILNPFYIYNFEEVFENFFIGVSNLEVDKPERNFLKFYAPYQISIFYLVLFVVATIYNVIFSTSKKIKIILILLFAGSVLYFLLDQVAQYIYSVLSLFALVSAIMICDIFKKLDKSKYLFVIILLTFFICTTFLRGSYYFINYKYDNRMEAGKWINKYIPRNSVIGIKFPPTNWDIVPFQFGNYVLKDYKINESAEYLILVSKDKTVSNNFKIIKSFKPKSIFGIRPVLKGEVEAIYAKTIDIYIKE